MFGFNVEKIRKDFPVLDKKVVYFDNACMSLKPRQVVEKMNEYYNEYSACAGRSSHALAKRTEAEVEAAREEARKILNARHASEIIFVRNATEGVNLVASGLRWEKGDEVVVSDKEHNSNFVPWLRLRERGVVFKVCPTNQEGRLDLDALKKLVTRKTRVVAMAHTSNLDGVTNPAEEIIRIGHAAGALVLLDGAQSFPHRAIDVREMGVDFFVLSGHKALGPTGVGVLYAKKELLEKMDPFLLGGHTVTDSHYEGYTLSPTPDRFEAGLQDYAGIIGFGEACRYLRRVGFDAIEKQELKLNKIVTSGLADEPAVVLVGPKDAASRGGIFSFYIRGMKAHDVANMLDSSKRIAVRAGAFCVHSWFNARKIDGVVRASFYFYNTEEEARLFVEEVKKIVKFAK